MQDVFPAVAKDLETKDLRIVGGNHVRPWGSFIYIDEAQIRSFAAVFFPHLTAEDLPEHQKFSPKMLMVAPHKRLSWQYHHRRAELWRVVEGPIGVAQSDTDEEAPPKIYEAGDIIVLRKGERHRLVGLDNWGVVAEIWQHTNPENPSDEDDIVRLQDDFKR